jgi:hypothetical protein
MPPLELTTHQWESPSSSQSCVSHSIHSEILLLSKFILFVFLFGWVHLNSFLNKVRLFVFWSVFNMKIFFYSFFNFGFNEIRFEKYFLEIWLLLKILGTISSFQLTWNIIWRKIYGKLFIQTPRLESSNDGNYLKFDLVQFVGWIFVETTRKITIKDYVRIQCYCKGKYCLKLI